MARLAPLPPVLRRLVWSLPEAWLPAPVPTVWVMAVDDHGNVVETEAIADWSMYAPFTDEWAWHPTERGKKVYKTDPETGAVEGWKYMLTAVAQQVPDLGEAGVLEVAPVLLEHERGQRAQADAHEAADDTAGPEPIQGSWHYVGY